MNIANKLPRGNVMWFLLFFAWASCATMQKQSTLRPGFSKTNEPMSVLWVPTVKPRYISEVKHDTVPVRRSPAELQAYLKSQYKLNYDDLFAPQFNALNKTVSDQAKSLIKLSEILQNVRYRSIMNNEASKKEIVYWRSQFFKLANENISIQKQQIKQQISNNSAQIRAVNSLTNKLMAGMGIILFFVIGSYAISFMLWKRIKQLNRSV